MPQPQHGLGLYRVRFQDAATDLGTCRIHIGCDANCQLATCGGLVRHVGPLATALSTGDRAEALMELLLGFQFCEANAFPAGPHSPQR